MNPKQTFNEEIQVLKDLGLTLNQAKIFLALIRTGKTNIKTISTQSKLNRETVYRMMPQLQKFGLVEKTISRPNLYNAIPLGVVLNILLNRQTQKTMILKQKIKKIVETEKKHKNKTSINEQSYFILIPNHETLLKKLRSEQEKAQSEIIAIASYKRHKHAIHEFRKTLKDLLIKGVHFRWIIEKSEHANNTPREMEQIHSHPNCSVKYISNSPKGTVILIDKKVLFIITEPQLGFADSPALKTNNHSIIEIIVDYFEALEKKAQESAVIQKLT